MEAKVPMTALMRQNYGDKALRTGDPFECTELEARDMEALHTATRRKLTKTAVITRVMDSEQKGTEGSDESQPSTQTVTQTSRQPNSKGGTYNRSDVRAPR